MRESIVESTNTGWRGIYIAGVSAILTLCGTLFDIVLSSAPGWQVTTVPGSVEQWFVQFAANPLLGLRNLDLLNAVIALVGLPMYVALYGLLHRSRAGAATLALIFVAVGTAVFVGGNVALPMLELSQQYGVETTESGRLVIQGAGAALLARGAHGSAGVFVGFLLPSVGTLLMAVAMLGRGAFTRIDGVIGILGTSLLMVYVIGVTFSDSTSAALLALAGLGGVLMMVWNVRVALILLRSAKRVPSVQAHA